MVMRRGDHDFAISQQILGFRFSGKLEDHKKRSPQQKEMDKRFGE
jgi:hypothetical protein